MYKMRFFLLINFTIFSSIADCQNVVKTMLRLPDTGQNGSFTNSFGEDSDFNINVPYFNLNGNGTITDTITGLMWQQTDGGEMTIENATAYCDTLNLAGFNNWRLPTALEAFSILNLQYANPALNTAVFTNSLAEYWWTSNRQANDNSKVWATNAGGGIGNHPKSETISAGGNKKFHVRAVRDINLPEIIPSRFTDNNNGTITDNLTNLVWQKSPTSDSLTWEQALMYADTLTIAGLNQWRLPNIKELQSINDESLINPSLNTIYFSVNSADKYWSSTSLPNQTAKAWYLNTQFGITTYDNKTIKHHLICVTNNSQLPTGLSISELKPDISLFPNPSNEKIDIKFNDEIAHLMNVEIYNYANNKVFSNCYVKVKGGFSIETAYFESGKYTIIIKEGNLIIKKSFLIIH